jgi:glucan 1,3-beta-glucosidase
VDEWDAFTGSFSNAVDQWTFDSITGAEEALMGHWNTYFTEYSINTIAATGIYALRIPIGFWAYDNSGTPYIQGADAFLERVIGWAKAASMKVWVDLHGAPGSQNEFDNSGHAGPVEWQQPDNLSRSIAILKAMATKYGSLGYVDTVIGLELVNEPISWGANVFSTTKLWVRDAFTTVKTSAANPNLTIIMNDAFEVPLAWTSLATSLSSTRQFAIDTHLYQHIAEACNWACNLAAANAVMPTSVGEWSAATNICVNPDGSTTASTLCSVAGCQCQSADFGTWNNALIQQVRRFVEAQLDVFESSTSGYFMWAAKGPGGWGFLNGIGNVSFQIRSLAGSILGNVGEIRGEQGEKY